MTRSCFLLFFVIAIASAGRLAAQSPPSFSGSGGTTLTVLHTFGDFPDASDGAFPDVALIQGNDGNFYGTTSGGEDNSGSAYGGSVFEVTPAGGFSVLYIFGSDLLGTTGGVIQGSDGNFYGTTRYGGFNAGRVFQLTTDGYLYTLHSFTGVDGEDPEAGLTLGNDGSFYGTTYSGGDSNGDGAIFKITLAGDFTSLYTFTGGAGGSGPHAGLTLGSDGNFYGTTKNGGDANGDGTVFEITPAGVFTTLHTFSGSDGRLPFAGLIQGSDGNFYGTTDNGGAGYGTVFKITSAGVFTSLYSFTGGAGGAYPFDALTQGSDGNFYGTTYGGGDSNGDGTIFKITPTGVLTTLYTFTGGADGANPLAGLTQDGYGNFYGTAGYGGQNGIGVVFHLTLPAAPVITSASIASGQEGQAFTYQITASNTPTSFGASGLPAGLSVDAGTGVISGTPTVSGTFSVSLSATNSGATGTSVLTLTLTPVVTLAAKTPQTVLGSGNAGVFTVSLSAPQSTDIVVSYMIKGTAINGVDYQLIKASKKIKAGKTSKNINIVPQGDLEGASKKVVTLVLTPGNGYTIGTTGKVKVKILSAP